MYIETRGNHKVDSIYFKVKDVSKEFGMYNLQEVIIKTNTKYLEIVNYNYFICKNNNKVLKNTNKTLSNP